MKLKMASIIMALVICGCVNAPTEIKTWCDLTESSNPAFDVRNQSRANEFCKGWQWDRAVSVQYIDKEVCWRNQYPYPDICYTIVVAECITCERN